MTTSAIHQAIAKVGADAFLESFSATEMAELAYNWPVWARPSQLAPEGDWTTWLVVAGRGFGKTRAGAEWIRSRVDAGLDSWIALVGRTPADARDVMIEGESGILAVFPPHQKPTYEPSKRRITFHNGSVATVYSSENPEQLRGPQHSASWCDELGTFKSADAWNNLQLGLRLGNPRQIVTTTPRPISTIRQLIKDENVAITNGTTYENRANLAPAFFRQIIRRYEGTRLGQQELMGLLLEDVPGALWQRRLISYRDAPDMVRVVVGVDPSVGDTNEIAECGIVAVGEGIDGNYYVLDDHSLRASPNKWAERVVEAWHQRPTDRIVAEVNQGGALVELTLRTVNPNIPYKPVRASTGKQARAEPVSALYEQGRVFHVRPFEELEDQMVSWVPGEGDSPDRIDALVWAFHDLALREQWSIVIRD